MSYYNDQFPIAPSAPKHFKGAFGDPQGDGRGSFTFGRGMIMCDTNCCSNHGHI